MFFSIAHHTLLLSIEFVVAAIKNHLIRSLFTVQHQCLVCYVKHDLCSGFSNVILSFASVDRMAERFVFTNSHKKSAGYI